MPFRRVLLQLPTGGETGISRVAHHRRRAIAICVLFLGSLQLSPAPSLSLEQPESNSTIAEEPITPIPEPPTIDPLKIKLGERLFGDPRLSHDNSRSCSSCHDLRTNGAGLNSQDVGLDGSGIPLNTPTIFNAALNFRFGWEGKLRTLESDAKAALENPSLWAPAFPRSWKNSQRIPACAGNSPPPTAVVRTPATSPMPS